MFITLFPDFGATEPEWHDLVSPICPWFNERRRVREQPIFARFSERHNFLHFWDCFL
jgi:hypothetical protein